MWWRAIVVLQVLQQFPTVSSQNYGNYYTTFAEHDYYCTYTHVNHLMLFTTWPIYNTARIL